SNLPWASLRECHPRSPGSGLAARLDGAGRARHTSARATASAEQRPRLRGGTRFLRECLKFASRALDHPFQICEELVVQLVVRLESIQGRLARCEQDGEHAPFLRVADHQGLRASL